MPSRASPPVSTAARAAVAQALAPCEGTPLRYVSDEMPGIRRLRRGGGFVYRQPDGTAVRDARELARIRSLAIPPAYTDVWICPLPDGHLQATGRDARRRKQYRYHPDWQALRDADKFDRMLAFGAALPRLRARVQRDLQRRGLPREKVLATLVRLLDTTFIRVGNGEYVRSNASYGLTTLRDRHADIRGETLRLKFRGKSGVLHQVSLEDRRIARIVKRCQDLPGQELFQYQDEGGKVCAIGSADVNDYLREAAGDEFTAKDFRTWHASVQALELLLVQSAGDQREAKRLIKEALTTVSSRLGNTVAVCRKSYVHPRVLSAFIEGTLAEPPAHRRLRVPTRLSAPEQRLMRFLQGTATHPGGGVSKAGGTESADGKR